ncbi:MAG: sacsin N-terminal ATP-binding-like domain-containing protein, partial [Actinomycetes bacterium]
MSRPKADPFDTAGLRAAVLDAWRASPTRYREDANVEEDYALGAYRDRLFIELAQNAADAARSAGVPGRMLVKVADDGLIVANTGAALDAAGVQSMAAMRASAKSGDGAVGRFGVGFAAVLAVTDAPAIASRDGGLRFSRNDSADLMRADPSLVELLNDRRPPLLRLPFAYDKTTGGPAGAAHEYDTLVILPWRDAAARAHAIEALSAVDDALFIALPDLVELVIEDGPSGVPKRWTASRTEDVLSLTIDDRSRQWQLHATSGSWSNADLADAPTEMRGRRSWSLTWAVPISSDGDPVDLLHTSSATQSPPPVVHAPTPTDEPLAFPALLVGDFPVDATRRRLA